MGSTFTLRACVGLWSICLAGCSAAVLFASDPSSDNAFYQTQVLPVLRAHCLECHSHAAGKARGGLVLDSRTSILAGGDSGPAVVPADEEASLLIEAIGYESDDLAMPPQGKIPDEQIEILKKWVQMGLPGPASGIAEPQRPPGAETSAAESAAGADATTHWAFQPLQDVSLPPHVKPGAEAIDHLLDEARRAAGVEAVGPAPRRDVIRRLYLDLIGLPPSPEELARLTDQDPPTPIAAIVDALLAMPEFGERWGRHWLDVARYADSNGCSIESNNTYDNAWRFRDYVIASLNEDKPYDQFVVEQVAGDLLDYVSDIQRSEQLVATGFLLLGPKAFGTGGFDQFRMDVIDEQIDTLGKATLGMSLGCARCHDHKFDPISTKDYYALAGVFASTESVRSAKGWRQGRSWHRVTLPLLDAQSERLLQKAYEETKQRAESGELEKEVAEQLKQAEEGLQKLRAERPEASGEIQQAEAAVEAARRELENAKKMAKVLPLIAPLPTAMAVAEKDEPVEEPVRIRGEVDTHGEIAPRQIPAFLDPQHPQQFAIPPASSGRLELARWLADSERGAGELLARVAVNRIWGHLFAQPLVASPDNFGVTGMPPSHPDLLDWLARRFIESGWSTKTLIRDIVLTQAYGLAAVEHPQNQQVDPDNLWLWRYEPKRVDVEVLRDSMLAITGQLDRTRGGKTLQHQGLVTLGEDHLVLDAPSPYRRRTVYIPILRDAIGLTEAVDRSMGMLSAFDFADPNLMSGLRSQTAVPGQALFLMNADFVYDQSRSLAEKLLEDSSLETDGERLQRLYALVYGRAASAAEEQQLQAFLGSFAGEMPTGDRGPSDDADTSTAASRAERFAGWTSLCQAVFGSNEFLFQD